MEFFANLGLGFGEALSFENMLYCFIGVFLGTMVGVLPGIGGITAIAMLMPAVFYAPPNAALIMLAGIYYGSMYGGSTTAIMLKVPGTVSSAVVVLDGYPMAQQGRAGTALVMSTVGSFIAGCAAILILALFAPALAAAALNFGSPEYAMVMVLGLLAATAMTHGSTIKGLAMIIVGLLFGLVGTDVATGARRMTFDLPGLADGISIVVVAIGLFGFSEIISKLENPNPEAGTIRSRLPWRELIPSWKDLKESSGSIFRGTILGSAVGILPGAGGAIASFGSYALEKRIAKDPSRFGKGAIEGVAGPESANNAAAQTSFIPTLTLGIPGSATMALMLGALIIHGIQPGPQLMRAQPDLFWGLIASMWIGNVFLLILNLPLIGLWIRLLTIPYRILYPSILVLACVGVYTIAFNYLDVLLAAGFGLLGYVFIKLGCEMAPMILGFVLGTLFEENLRRSMLIGRGDPMIFLERPVSLGLFVACVAIVVVLATPGVRKSMREGTLSRWLKEDEA